jgi:hypothetical protein
MLWFPFQRAGNQTTGRSQRCGTAIVPDAHQGGSGSARRPEKRDAASRAGAANNRFDDAISLSLRAMSWQSINLAVQAPNIAKPMPGAMLACADH